MSSEQHEVITVSVEEILDLRWRELRVGRPRHTASMQGDDAPTTTHWAVQVEGRVVACASIMAAVCPEAPWHTAQLRGMAVSSEHQRRGIGAAMLAHIARETPGLWCNARQTALGFYARNGWRIVGRPMSFPHIGPHRRMLHPAAPLPDESPDVLHAGRFLRLTRRGHWEMTERRGCSGVVGIVPITEAGELVLVEQFRPPVNANVIELPAGLSGDLPGHESEPLVEAAKRELAEETGFIARSWQEIAAGPVSAGLTNEHVTLFLAEGLQRVSAGGGDASEDIQIHIIPLRQCLSWLEERRSEGLMVDQKVWTGILFALQKKTEA